MSGPAAHYALCIVHYPRWLRHAFPLDAPRGFSHNGPQMHKATFLAVAAALAAQVAPANIFETNETQKATLALAETWGRDAAAASTNAVWRRGLVADKATDTVTILAEACDIARGATVEFPIIGELSDRDYEAAFRTFARPGDVAEALESLGLPRGRNVDPAKMRFWALGERVAIDVRPLDATNATWRPIQSYIIDRAAGKTPEWDGFVYCGSPDDPQDKAGRRLADTVAPNSILATYNEPQSVLDTPVVSSQSAVYERFVLAPDAPFKPFARYEIRFRPIRRADGRPRVAPADVLFKVDGGKVVASYGAPGVGGPMEIPAFFEALAKSRADGFDTHLTVKFGEDLTVLQAATVARLLEKCEDGGDVRMAPPPDGFFYYKGFMPNEAWRDAKQRIAQPWEIHFQPTNATPIRLVQTVEDWSDQNSLDPRLTVKEFKVGTPEEAAGTIAKADAALPPNLRMSVALVFAPKDAALSAIMPTIRAILPTHPTIYVFQE